MVLPFSGWSCNSTAVQQRPAAHRVHADVDQHRRRGEHARAGSSAASSSKGAPACRCQRSVARGRRLHRPRRAEVIAELTLARNVIAAQPSGSDDRAALQRLVGQRRRPRELRVLPIANAEENQSDARAPRVDVDGSNARVFRNGDLAYVVTNVRANACAPAAHRAALATRHSGQSGPVLRARAAGAGRRLSRRRTPSLRGKIDAADSSQAGAGTAWGWWGCYVVRLVRRRRRGAGRRRRARLPPLDAELRRRQTSTSTTNSALRRRPRQRRRAERRLDGHHRTIPTAGGATCGSSATRSTPRTTSGYRSPSRTGRAAPSTT